MSRVIMIQGTHSTAGKSLVATALCRIFARDGWRVAPFKAQNMSLNAGVTPQGGEMGRAQLVQAEAAGIEPHTDMNPILLKPEGHAISQVIVDGKVYAKLSAGNFYTLKQELWQHAAAALDRLRSRYEIVVIEGAGSPAEINLKAGDITNMKVAVYANAPVLLVGDIDRGGVFAALVGTMTLLEEDERRLVKGFLINKLRGDPALLGDGLKMLQDRAFGVPTLGVIPYLPDPGIADEDSVSLDYHPMPRGESGSQRVDIGVVQFPHISNFDEFDALKREQAVDLRYIQRATDFGNPQALILPGSKMTVSDLQWLVESGLAGCIQRFALQGGRVVGVCGGYQMMGKSLNDPQGIESPAGTQVDALNLLPVETVMGEEKITLKTTALAISSQGAFSGLGGQTLKGYQIHAGRSGRLSQEVSAVLTLPNGEEDGAISPDGRIWGCYLHGIFENDALRHAWLREIGWQDSGVAFERDAAYNRLADHFSRHVDMDAIYRLMGIEGQR